MFTNSLPKHVVILTISYDHLLQQISHTLGTKKFPFILLANVIDVFVVAMDHGLYDQ